MINGQMLLATLAGQQVGRRRVSLVGIVLGVVAALVAVAVVGGILTFTAYRLWLGWQTGQWDGFWTLAINGIIFLVLPVFALMPLSNQQRRLAPAIPALRQIAAAREDALTPPVVPQPVALLDDALQMGAVKIGPLKRLVSSNTKRTLALIPLFWVIIFVLFTLLGSEISDFQLGPILPFSFVSYNHGLLFPNIFSFTILVLFILLLGGMFIWLAYQMSPTQATMMVSADAEGVRWRPRGFVGERRIAWRDVRSFSRITTTLPSGTSVYAAMYAGLGVIYLLDGPDASLLWSLSPTANDHVYAASEQLSRLIVSRTGLPLCDLTSVANDLALTCGNVHRIIMMRSVMGNGATASPTLQSLALTPPAPPARVWPHVAPILVASLLPLLLSAAIFGYGAYVQNYQQGYFASLPQRLHSETPLFQDTLDTANEQWPVGPITKPYHQGERFVHGVYELYGDDPTQSNWVWENSSPLFGDAAFEVTVSEHGALGSGGSDGIGLIFNIDNYGDNFSLFEIYADGRWALEPFHNDASQPSNSWGYADSGSSSAIHQGIGATNTLLVLKRGKEYLLYVNNHFIEVYYDRDSVLPSLGYVGLHLNDDAQTGDFSNLSVYPVQPPLSEWYV